MAGRYDLDRVHFYSEHDMATPYEVDKIINRLRAINPYGNITNLNDVMELWNIHQYSKRSLLPINLKEVDEKYLKDIISKLQGIIVQLISQWPKEDFEKEYEKLSYDHQHNFWEVIVETKAYKLFTKDVLLNCVKHSSKYALRSVLVEKELVKYLDNELAIYLKNCPYAVEVFLDNYYVSTNPKERKVCLPASLTIVDREEMILKYINSPERNLNYLRIISSLKNDNTLTISDRTRLLCKRAEKEENKKVLKESFSIPYKISIAADFKKLHPIVELTNEGIKYNLACLEYLDAKAIILLFKNVFGFIDQFGTIPLTSLDHEDVLYDIFGLRGVSWHRTTPSFNKKNKIALMQLSIIEKGFDFYGKSTESIFSSIIDWINITFNINFKYNSISEVGPTLSKIRHLFAEMDSLIRQYQLFAEDGSIDYELLTMSSSPLGLTQFKSALYPSPKYVSLTSDSSEAKWLQTMLSSKNNTFTKKGNNGYESLFTQIKQGDTLKFKYKFQQNYINVMIEKGIINLSSEGQYRVTPAGELLNILFHKDFVMIDRLPIEISNNLPLMKNLGWIEYSSSLLHIREANYFNYWLNKKDFSNGYDLRNKYMHGVQSLEEKNIESDYRIAKLLFILLLLKIIDDLELKGAYNK